MKTTKSILYFVLGTFVLFMTSCEPKKLKEEDVLLSNAQVEDIIKDGQLYNINEFLTKFMDPGKGNFASDSTHYRKRANDSKYPDIWLFSIDTLPTNGPGIYIRGRVTTDDYAGNFYKSIVIQQTKDWKTGVAFDPDRQQTLRISLDMGSAGGLYQLGQEILIRCNGLAIGRYANQPQLAIPVYNDKTTASHADEKVGWEPGRIPNAVFRKAVTLIGAPDPSALVYYEPNSLEELFEKIDIEPEKTVGGMQKTRIQDGMLVRLKNVWFSGHYSNYGNLEKCVAGDPDPGDGKQHSEINVFAPTTGNIGFPQSRVLTDLDYNWDSLYIKYDFKKDTALIKAKLKHVILCSTSEYAKYAHYYLPGASADPTKAVVGCKDYKGTVTGILGFYLDNAGDFPGSSADTDPKKPKMKGYKLKWAITPRGIPGYGISDIELKNAEGQPWIPVEYDPSL